METVQRLIGICQICEGEFKLDQSANMVHHGYQRPGHGYIVGDCQAVGYPAYEQSCELLVSYTVGLSRALQVHEAFQQRLQSGEVLELTVINGRRGKPMETITYKVGDREWPMVLDRKISEEEYLINLLTSDIKRCDARIAAWKPLPIRTVDEVEAQQRASKADAAAAREAKRQAKLAAKIASYQKRIDSAVRRHTTSTLGDIFETAPGKIRDIIGCTHVEALKMLERDYVWVAFGLDLMLPKQERDVRGGNAEICSNMRYPEYHFETKKYPWPEGLK